MTYTNSFVGTARPSAINLIFADELSQSVVYMGHLICEMCIRLEMANALLNGLKTQDDIQDPTLDVEGVMAFLKNSLAEMRLVNERHQQQCAALVLPADQVTLLPSIESQTAQIALMWDTYDELERRHHDLHLDLPPGNWFTRLLSHFRR